MHLLFKVVDLINSSPETSRPSVLVSATAVGYYGWLSHITNSHPSFLNKSSFFFWKKMN